MTEPPTSGTRVTNLLDLLAVDPTRLPELEQFRRTLVVMFSDIQGSTAYFEKHGDAAGLVMVHQCNDTVRRLVDKHGGTLIKTIGDGTMSAFQESKGAVDAAIEIQTALSKLGAARAEGERISLRIGMHYGSGIVKSNDVFGDVVNTASRVESVAAAGQIVISEETYGQVRECGFAIRELGRFTLKGKTGERTLFRVIWNPVQGVPTEYGVAPLDLSSQTLCSFKLQLVHRDGSAGTEYPVQSELAVVLSPEGDLLISQDFRSPSVCARVFLQGQALFVEERSAVGEGVFLRLTGAYVLEHQDIFLVGQQVFRYEEKPETSSSMTVLRTGLAESEAAASDIAELVRTDAGGNPTGRYPLPPPEVQLGRTRGTYVFPDDNLMSRAHIRISQRGEDFVLEDVGSRNGTFVKVRRKMPLPSGSALLIAGQLLRVIH
jgi:class 3 adenylate cyclase